MPKKSNLKNNVEVHEDGAELCECKQKKGRKLYENWCSWFTRPPVNWEDLTPEQKNAWLMASNNKRND